MSSEPETFALRTTLTSPFGRKVRMAVDVLGLSDRVTIVPADTADENDTLRQQNPLGKIPCLVRGDGTSIYDSGVIVEFLQSVADSDQLLPRQGPARFPMFTLARLADGIIDAAIAVIYEERYHEPGARSEVWIAYQRGKIMRGLAAFEAAPPDASNTTAVSIGLACALGFFDKRKVMEWRPTCPRLAAWFATFTDREAAYERTRAPSA
jgi:glutathione S-transferase